MLCCAVNRNEQFEENNAQAGNSPSKSNQSFLTRLCILPDLRFFVRLAWLEKKKKKKKEGKQAKAERSKAKRCLLKM